MYSLLTDHFEFLSTVASVRRLELFYLQCILYSVSQYFDS